MGGYAPTYMRILITNDDGILAPGIAVLANVAADFGDVVVVAPDRERSACGHAFTMRNPIRVREVEGLGLEAYACDGVPTDCVNFAYYQLLNGELDLVLSGINSGPNLGFDATYSGTVAAAMEGAINGVRSIAVSLAMFVEPGPAYWDTADRWLRENLGAMLRMPFPELAFYNVNIPSIAYDEVRGTRFARMGLRVYENRFEKRLDPYGNAYYWQGSSAHMQAAEPNTDLRAVSDGFVSVTPMSLDWTRHTSLDEAHQAFFSRSSQPV